MKKRFIVCIDKSTKEQDQQFIQFLKENNIGWWHWIKNTWLLNDDHGIMSVRGLRDMAANIFYQEHNIVFQLNAENEPWAGYGPNDENKNMFNWIRKNWKKY